VCSQLHYAAILGIMDNCRGDGVREDERRIRRDLGEYGAILAPRHIPRLWFPICGAATCRTVRGDCLPRLTTTAPACRVNHSCTGTTSDMWVAVQTRPSPVSYQASEQEAWRRRMGTLVVGAKKARRTERQRISASPGGRAQVWLIVVLTLVVVAIGIWVSAMVFL
jgi:hypothetical protein